MGTVFERRGRLFLDFYYRGKRCREATPWENTPHGRSRADKFRKQIEGKIALNQFHYSREFPGSPMAERCGLEENRVAQAAGVTSTFAAFARLWFDEKRIEWREAHQHYQRDIIENVLIPYFGNKYVHTITRADVLKFRATVSDRPGQKGNKVGRSRVKKIMDPLRGIIEEASDRFGFKSPWKNIKLLAPQRHEVNPFSLKEVWLLVRTASPEWKNYLTVRFFTGLRTGEINALEWKHVDFDRNVINISQSLSRGKIGPTKTLASNRSVHMIGRVREALENQKLVYLGKDGFVFRSAKGLPVDNHNFRERVWKPLLRKAGLEERSPYQTRHTAASLWLGSGESPEWIARQMGHTTTEMLFRVYSRYIPNLTRQDGSAFEKVLEASGNDESRPGTE